jgi:Tat protein translocase TatB subunit
VFSVSPAEILTIAVVALLVFGPKRLPEIARKAGKVIRDLRDVAGELTSGLEDEVKETLEPFRDIRTTMKDAIAGVEGEVTGVPARPRTAPAIAPAAAPREPNPTDAAADGTHSGEISAAADPADGDP